MDDEEWGEAMEDTDTGQIAMSRRKRPNHFVQSHFSGCVCNKRLFIKWRRSDLGDLIAKYDQNPEHKNGRDNLSRKCEFDILIT